MALAINVFAVLRNGHFVDACLSARLRHRAKFFNQWLREIPAFAEAYETAKALEEAYFLENGAIGISARFAAAKLGLGKEKPVESAEETAPTEIIFSVAEPVGKIVTTNMGEVEE